jgi:hypothetical protein
VLDEETISKIPGLVRAGECDEEYNRRRWDPEGWKMKVRGILAVLLLSAASMWAQTGAEAATADAPKPADHAACKHDKDSKMACCKKDKDGNMVKGMDCCKKGKCARCKKMESEKKS